MPRFKNENHSIEKICPTCGNIFKTFQSQDRLYCSSFCYHQGGNKRCKPTNKVIKKCDFCGKDVIRPASDFHAEKTFCNYSCMAQWQSAHLRQSNHPRWAGGRRNTRGCGWRAAKKEARRRSKGKCQICKQPANTVHHKIPVRCFQRPSDAHHQTNLVVLCESCHPKMEKVFRDSMPLLNLIQWKDQERPETVF